MLPSAPLFGEQDVSKERSDNSQRIYVVDRLHHWISGICEEFFLGERLAPQMAVPLIASEMVSSSRRGETALRLQLPYSYSVLLWQFARLPEH